MNCLVSLEMVQYGVRGSRVTNNKIFFADLTHTAQGISAPTFPLGISYVAAYARQELGKEFDFHLFKFPEDLEKALVQAPPLALFLSNYSWNFELAYKLASLAKARYPDLIVVCGGPNFPTNEEEQHEHLRLHPNIDFYIQLEGEIGAVELIKKLAGLGFDARKLKAAGQPLLNTAYLEGGKMIVGPLERIKDINTIPSPYLSGMLDPFFGMKLIPMLETTRGCPFSCTFCADGLATKNKVVRYSAERTRDELEYIAARVKNIDELVITDLNFAMYAEDRKTAEAIADVQKRTGWPIGIGASAGKNRPQRVIDVASILQGSWVMGASIQSTDPHVLKSIKRSNISSAAYKELIDYGNSFVTGKTHSEIILGLPGDTKEKHFESLRFGVDNSVNSMRMFQAMLLMGTEMADQATRKQFGLVTKFRTIPGCVGIYDFFGQKVPVSEIEEIIIGSKELPFEDYLECRLMNLITETFYNNAMFDEVYSMIRTIGGSVFDCLLYIKNHREKHSPRVQEIVSEFLKQTSVDLYDSRQETEQYVLTPEIINRYIGGELGINELLVHRALLFCEFEDICGLLFQAVSATLKEKNLLTDAVAAYLKELQVFTLLRKDQAITRTDITSTGWFRFDFEAIGRAAYKVNPNALPQAPEPVEFRFFHTDEQKKHIANQVGVYANTPMGLGRLIQRSNLKLFYRTFRKADPAMVTHGR